jgi:hypothetical protein
VKIALLPDPRIYGYAYSLLVDTSDRLGLDSIQQILEDFLRLAIKHTIEECVGQPKKGWVCSVPQFYRIVDVQNFQRLIQNAGVAGNIYIHGESDCIVYTNLPWIEDFTWESREAAFKQGQNFLIIAGVFDLGASTMVITTRSIDRAS